MAVIGITPSNRINDYLESVRRAGGEPRVLSIDSSPTLDGLDGLLFTGGGDIDPAHYRDARDPNTDEETLKRLMDKLPSDWSWWQALLDKLRSLWPKRADEMEAKLKDVKDKVDKSRAQAQARIEAVQSNANAQKPVEDELKRLESELVAIEKKKPRPCAEAENDLLRLKVCFDYLYITITISCFRKLTPN